MTSSPFYKAARAQNLVLPQEIYVTIFSLMSRNARKYCLQSTSCPTGLFDIFIHFIFDIILCVLVGFY